MVVSIPYHPIAFLQGIRWFMNFPYIIFDRLPLGNFVISFSLPVEKYLFPAFPVCGIFTAVQLSTGVPEALRSPQ
jgi:hypothetical protein